MEFYDLITKRCSVRNYDKNRKLDDNTILKILNASRLAPSAANKQPWKIIVISSPEKLQEIKKCYNKPWFHNAPHVLVVKGKTNEAWQRSYDGYNSIETDLAILMTYIILAAANEGVGTCWIANFNPEILKEVLHLTKDEKVFGITPLGYPEQGSIYDENKIRKSIQEIVEFL